MLTQPINKKLHRVETNIDEIDLKELFIYFKNHKLFIVAVTSITFLLGIFYSFMLPVKYESSALIQIENQSAAGNAQQMLGSLGSLLAVNAPASIVEVETALINSRYILHPVIEKLNLNITVAPHYFPIFGAAYARSHAKAGLAKPFMSLSHYAWSSEKIKIKQLVVPDEFESKKFTLQVDDAQHYSLFSPKGKLLLHGTVGTPAKTQDADLPQVNILVTEMLANPGLKVDVTYNPINDLISALSQSLMISDLGTKDRARTGILQLSLQGSNAALLPEILNTIVDYTVKKDIEKKSSDISKMLDVLTEQIPVVHKNLDDAETLLNSYRSNSGTIDMSTEGKILLAELANIEKEIDELKIKRVEMLQELTPEHPSIIMLDEKKIQLQKEFNDLKTRIKSLPQADQRAISLQREVKVKNELYLSLLNKTQQLQVLKGSILGDVRILNHATKPRHPLPVHKSFILISSIMAGLFLSILVLFMRKISQKEIQDVDHIEEQLGISILTVIPHSKLQAQMHHTTLLAKSYPKDMSVEAIRSLRTSLQVTMLGAKNNIVTLLGSGSNIGKSFISSNLAQVLSAGGKRIILMDGDMRKGKIHHYLGQKASPGLSELLADKITLETAVRKINNHFDFIPAGSYSEHPSELLMGPQLAALLNSLSNNYDLVLINTPPILAVTDGILLAQFAATNLIVANIENEQLKDLNFAVKYIKKNGITINGLVFNNKTAIKSGYGQHYHNYMLEEKLY